MASERENSVNIPNFDEDYEYWSMLMVSFGGDRI